MSATLPLPDFHHERVETLTGRRSGLFIAVALHSSVLGSALGGARLWSYPHWSDALGDALRLSAAMTLKNAAAGLDAGGGKSVIALPAGHPARRGASACGVPRPRRRRRVDARALPHRGGRRLDDRGHAHGQRAHQPRRRSSRGGRRLGRARGPDQSRRVRVAARDTRAGDRLPRCRRSPHHDLGNGPGRQPPRRAPEHRRRPTHGHRRQPRQARPRAPARRRVDRPGRGAPGAGRCVRPCRHRRSPDRRGHRRARCPRGLRPGEQPARRSLRCRAARSARHPVRTRLRRERRRRDLPRPRSQAARQPRADHGPGRRDRRHRAPRLRRGGVAGSDPARGRRGSGCGASRRGARQHAFAG